MQQWLVLALCPNFHSFISLSLFVGFLLGNIGAQATNTTIDDTNPAFSFGENWSSITPGNPCSWCATKLDPSLVYNSTWHDGGSVGLVGTLQFEGSAVQLFGATVGTSTAEIAFTLDNGSPTNYDLNTVSQSVSHMYNVLLFSSSGLSNGKHTLSWTLAPVTSPAAFSSSTLGHVALIDYAVVSSDVDPPSPSENEPVTSLPPNDSSSIVSSPAPSINSPVASTPALSVSSSSATSSAGTTLNTSGTVSSKSISSSHSTSGFSSISTMLNPTLAATVTISASASAPPANSTDASRDGSGQGHVHLIVAEAVGGAAGAILILCIILFIWRRRYLHRIESNGLDPGPTGTIYLSEKRLAYMRELEHATTSSESLSRPNYHNPEDSDSQDVIRVVDSAIDPESGTQTQQMTTSTNPIEDESSNSTASPSPNVNAIHEINQRVAMLEMMMQSPMGDRAISFTSPPPY
ncbi:hypothetical protein D9757_009949 [Collybiopsis confluens]|uniref:Uncharacterized protein n=1 Tax=Collybiopsis confluens TaxID=2823264 RepID=A0A8H5LZ85_9AGAR|nr:hypothetical protein D9757_009949 [Collybiopsis confluens]